MWHEHLITIVTFLFSKFYEKELLTCALSPVLFLCLDDIMITVVNLAEMWKN